MNRVAEREFAAARRRELGLVALRWLLVAFGVAQALLTPAQDHPDFVVPLGWALTAGLALGNVAVWSAALRARDLQQVRVIGLTAFVLDAAVALGLLWASTASPSDPVWVVGYLVPLEGAARYGVVGGVIGAALFAGSELLREQYLAGTFPGYAFDRSALGYRAGMAFVVAVVTGAYSRSLRRETARAEERAEAAERLAAREAEARAQLEELDVMKTDFIAITSHELRTPLAAVSGFVDTLRRRRAQLTEREVEEFLAIIQLQTARLTRLVEDLLVVSRLEAGKLTFHAEPVAVGSFLADVIRGLGDDASRVDLHQDPELPVTISVDSQRLAQIMTNLLTNAVKFAPEDTRVVLRASIAGSSAVAFEVSDRGPGIAPEEIDRIFDRFHQAMEVQTRQAEGAGLGLYITRQLTGAMGGTVDVASAVGEGSTFRVTIPREPPAGSRAPARRSATERSD